MSIDAYRKAIATQGLLAHATAPKPEGKPLTEQQRQEAMRELYVANHLRRLDEEPELAAALKKLQSKKRGTKPKWGAPQKAVLIAEVESGRPTRRKSLLLPKASIRSVRAVCNELARQDHWKEFLRKADDPGKTLRQEYSGCKDDQNLRKIARRVMEMDASRRETFVRNVLAPFVGQQGRKQLATEQSGSQVLQQVMLESRSIVSSCSE